MKKKQEGDTVDQAIDVMVKHHTSVSQVNQMIGNTNQAFRHYQCTKILIAAKELRKALKYANDHCAGSKSRMYTKALDDFDKAVLETKK